MANAFEAHAPSGPYMHGGRSYLRAPVPVVFPSEDPMPETGRHLRLRTLLYLIFLHNYAQTSSVGSEQFVYWNTQDPRQCCAPDIFLRLGQPHGDFDIWKVWERGAPDVAVEIISPSDASDADWSSKLERYRAMGVKELVRFDPADETAPLRIWDNIEADLVERDVEIEGGYACAPLGLTWVVVADGENGRALRIARGSEWLLTGQEEERRAKEAAVAEVAELRRQLAERD